MPADLSISPANLERFSGFADRYDAFRPQPPPVIPEILCQLVRTSRPALVVDIGSGTGLSTRLWAGRADEIVGIEPNQDMRRQAVDRTARESHAASIRYQDGLSSKTGLPDHCADIVTCSQALHWMDPEPTFAEVARILRLGGVFAAYDCDWPPTFNQDAEQAYKVLASQAEAIGRQRGFLEGVRKWGKDQHLERLRGSGQFQYVKEITAHHREEGDYNRLVGLAMSQGTTATLLKRGIAEAEIGIDRLREVTRSAIGDSPVPWYWSYRICIAIP
ncbi:MAG TPA: class I SAM-dependent methyltransferase [Armatimonadota bacterium]|nr:class I SAM-dependent methyltransferase [Armatimonadota bacterium]